MSTITWADCVNEQYLSPGKSVVWVAFFRREIRCEQGLFQDGSTSDPAEFMQNVKNTVQCRTVEDSASIWLDPEEEEEDGEMNKSDVNHALMDMWTVYTHWSWYSLNGGWSQLVTQHHILMVWVNLEKDCGCCLLSLFSMRNTLACGIYRPPLPFSSPLSCAQALAPPVADLLEFVVLSVRSTFPCTKSRLF